ncbi:MAG: MATE family efflux transporter [Bacteroidetes bacterium]|nr:MATE family efflux transporter [Bacteroidota bacterium]
MTSIKSVDLWPVNNLLKHNHLKETISLSIPLVLTQIGHIITGMVDNIFLGKIGKTEQAAGILSNNLYVILLVFSIGMSYVLTPAITDAHVNQNEKEKAALFKNSLFINMMVAILLFVILFFSSPLLGHMQQPEDVVKLAIPFFDVLIFSIIPIALFFVCKQYTEGLSNTKAAMYISVAGNILNIILNYCLIYGKAGLPELGYMGSCWATFISRLFMGLGFLVFVFNHRSVNSFAKYYKEARLNALHFWPLFKDGIASALQFTFEVAAFAIAGLLAGVFGKEQIDAHGIALSLAAFTYMFASGIGSATTIRVGNYYAKNDLPNLKSAIKTSYKSVLVTMGCMALLFVCFNTFLPTIFSSDAEIIFIASKLLLFAALFQLFDGTQVVAIGALRGLEDYQFPTYIAFVGYWLVALPLCYLFAFTFGYKVYGVWLALSIGLGFVATALSLRIRNLIRLKSISL